jgi:hypothetical protein
LDRYFCEPAYEKFRGTSEGVLNSRLYNEKAYVLSRGFILRALEKPPGSLEGEVRGFYLPPPPPPAEGGGTGDTMGQDEQCAEWDTSRGRGGGQRRLERVLKETKNLISLSQELQQRTQARPPPLNEGQPLENLTGPPPVPDDDAAVPSLTKGGILTLQRILSKLLNFQPDHPQLSSETVSTSN